MTQQHADAEQAGPRTPGLHLGRRFGEVVDRVWPLSLVRRFGPIVGVVEGLVDVRAEYLRAWHQGRTFTRCATDWLEELVAYRSEELAYWRKYALERCEQAVGAYELVRGEEPSVVPTECFR